PRPPDSCTAFQNLAVAVQRRCLQLQLARQKIAPDFELIEKLRARANRAISVSAELAVVHAARGRLILYRAKTTPLRPGQRAVKLDGPAGEILFGGVEIRWKICSGKPSRPPGRVAGSEVFDADAVGRRIILRHWQPGDRFQPIGMPAPVK